MSDDTTTTEAETEAAPTDEQRDALVERFRDALGDAARAERVARAGVEGGRAGEVARHLVDARIVQEFLNDGGYARVECG